MFFSYVSIKDLTENGDINWNKSVEEIDRQLYKKNDLEDTEIAFFESMIKPI